MARFPGKTKAEETAELVAAAVGAGRKVKLPTVDFSDPDRPKTCLEVDFPILPINQIAQIEGNAGKPIYQMSKWWARRRSSVFRSTLIAAATRAPDDPLEAARTVWDAYYANHQDNEAFRKLKVADIFMGGGTTLVEGARLGMQMFGNDLNPVAWFVVKNELAQVDLDEVQKLFDVIEREVKPQIMPFYACEGPAGERGTWTNRKAGEVMGDDFDPLALTPEERKDYSYEGPEVIYTFWAKHGPCSAPGCGHRTPLFTSPVIAVKTLTVKAWAGFTCVQCHRAFDIERQEARMAPDASLVVADGEPSFAIMDDEGRFTCPHCGHAHRDEVAAKKGVSSRLPKKGWKNKKVSLSLLIHPDWMKGEASMDEDGKPFGGTATSGLAATQRWQERRGATLRLLEVRGELPETITCPDTGIVFNTSDGTVPKKSTFTCQAETCGKQQDVLGSIKASGATGPVAAYALQCYSPARDDSGATYDGRYFKPVGEEDVRRMNAAWAEWESRKDADLRTYWPRSELPFGFMTHKNNGGIPNHGYTHWYKMFNARQLLVHSLLLRSIDTAFGFTEIAKQIVLGAFQQYLNFQNMFCHWNIQRDCIAQLFSHNNFHPKATVVESAVFCSLGSGNWQSWREAAVKGLEWAKKPWEAVSNQYLLESNDGFDGLVSGKSERVQSGDAVIPRAEAACVSATELTCLADASYDAVITDPPFGGLLHYSELADFFYVWMRLYLKDKYPDYFVAEFTPKTLEAVSNRARHPDDSDEFYKRLLTASWREAHRILKPGGLLAFTFHHSEDAPWIDVLESLFDAGFYLESTYPIRSDETKGQGAKPGTFGSQTIEYDIVHVCRKRTKDPARISWPRLRRQIMADVRQLQDLLEHHQRAGLPKADIQVIKRGKALEYFSRHYGQVYVEQGREFTVKEALAGINDILDEEMEGEIRTPVNCEPMTRQFLRIFAKQAEVPRDQMQKYLRGSGIGPSEFVERGWCFEKKKTYFWVSTMDFAQAHAAKAPALRRDLDQALLLVGAFHPESGVSSKRILTDDFRAHPALGALLDWLIHNHPEAAARHAAASARTRFNTWAAQHQGTLQEQLTLFGLEEAP
ncbi:MAG: DUF1156 domain-containing protein [Bdellovibrio bacteriovorus]